MNQLGKGITCRAETKEIEHLEVIGKGREKIERDKMNASPLKPEPGNKEMMIHFVAAYYRDEGTDNVHDEKEDDDQA
jgi:hypothetical protein